MLDSELDLATDRHIITEQYGYRRSIAMPIFAEAAAQAVRLLDVPISILTTSAGTGYLISAIVGLERLPQVGIDADLHVALAGLEYCHAQTIGSNGKFIVANLCDDLLLAQSAMHCKHGIQAYLGSPIKTAARDLLGAISILDFSPRQFSDREIEILQSIGRWSSSEFERKLLSQAQLDRWVGEVRGFDDLQAAIEHDRSMSSRPPVVVATGLSKSNTRSAVAILQGEDSQIYPQLQTELQFELLTHLAQELRTPLTAVLGMTSVLQQEIYGTLNDKQKDYLEIVHQSGERSIAIVNEIAQLGGFVISAALPQRQQPQLTLRAVDLEMLCRLALQSLEPSIRSKHQQITIDLSSEHTTADRANARIWVLDKDKVRQITYYLCLSLIHVTAPHHQISIQIANLTDGLQIRICTNDERVVLQDLQARDPLPTVDRLPTIEANIGRDLRIRLGLALSQTLASTHGGKIEVLATDRGYQLNLPLIVGDR
jgi:signal transduction histidine kinase